MGPKRNLLLGGSDPRNPVGAAEGGRAGAAAAQRQAPPRNAATKATQECIAGFGAFSTQAAVATASCS
jgi:hypothetical protein